MSPCFVCFFNVSSRSLSQLSSARKKSSKGSRVNFKKKLRCCNKESKSFKKHSRALQLPRQ